MGNLGRRLKAPSLTTETISKPNYLQVLSFRIVSKNAIIDL